MPNPTPSYTRTLGIVGGIGFQFVIAVSAGVGLGVWADKKFETGIVMTLIGLVLGLVASGVVVYRLLRLLGTGSGADTALDVSEEDKTQ